MPGQTAIVTTISVGPTAPVLLLAAKPNRAAAIIYNVSGTLQVKYGTDSAMPPWTRTVGGSSELVIDNCTGPIWAIKASGTTNVYVTDIW